MLDHLLALSSLGRIPRLHYLKSTWKSLIVRAWLNPWWRVVLMGHPGLFFVYFRSFRTIYWIKTVDFSGVANSDHQRPLDHGPRNRLFLCPFQNWSAYEPSPASFTFIFSPFQTNINTIFTINECLKCPSRIRCWDSNPQPSDCEKGLFLVYLLNFLLNRDVINVVHSTGMNTFSLFSCSIKMQKASVIFMTCSLSFSLSLSLSLSLSVFLRRNHDFKLKLNDNIIIIIRYEMFCQNAQAKMWTKRI